MEIDGIKYKSGSEICKELGVSRKKFDLVRLKLAYHPAFATAAGESLVKKVGRFIYFNEKQTAVFSAILAPGNVEEQKNAENEPSDGKQRNDEVAQPLESDAPEPAGMPPQKPRDLPISDNPPESGKQKLARFVLEFMSSMGWTSINKPAESCIDLVLAKADLRCAVTVNEKEEDVTWEVIDELVLEAKKLGCSASSFVTNGYFSDEAKNLAQIKGCSLIDSNILHEWQVIVNGKF